MALQRGMGLLPGRGRGHFAHRIAGPAVLTKTRALTRVKSGRSAAKRNIRAISDLEHHALAERTPGQKWADAVANSAGRFSFAVGHFVWFALWIFVNTEGIGPLHPFDPYPFPLLTLVTSLEAIFLSLFILTSQNRATAQADRRSHLDLQINLLAESESTATLKMLRALCKHQGLKIADDPEIGELAERTEPKTLIRDLQDQLPDAS
jgi:uncharacterized membrane protein